MRRRWSLVLAVVMVLSMALAGCGGNEEKLSRDEILVVGMEAGYPPYNWTQLDDSNGAVKIDGAEYAGGYDVEIAKKIADAMGKKLVIEKIEWEGLLPGLESGMIDIIAAGMSPTAERAESIDFTDTYYRSDLVMIVKKDSPYANATSIEDFKGAKITGQQNTFHYSVIDQIDGVIKDTAMQDFPSMRTALQSGIIDGYVSERPEGISATSVLDDFVMVEFEDGFKTDIDDVAIAIGVKKGSPLTEEINEILSEISEEERQEIMDRAIVNQPAAE